MFSYTNIESEIYREDVLLKVKKVFLTRKELINWSI